MSIAGRISLLACLVTVDCLLLLADWSILSVLASFAVTGACVYAMKAPRWVRVAYKEHDNVEDGYIWTTKAACYLGTTFCVFLLLVILPHKMVDSLNAGNGEGAMTAAAFLLALLIALGYVLRRSDDWLAEFSRSMS